MSVFSERIRALREDHDLNQTQMAQILGTNQRKVSRMETGENEPNLNDIAAYCACFDVSADYLLGLTEKPYKLSERE